MLLSLNQYRSKVIYELFKEIWLTHRGSCPKDSTILLPIKQDEVEAYIANAFDGGASGLVMGTTGTNLRLAMRVIDHKYQIEYSQKDLVYTTLVSVDLSVFKSLTLKEFIITSFKFDDARVGAMIKWMEENGVDPNLEIYIVPNSHPMLEF